VLDRVMVFIDGSNFYWGLKTNYGRTDLDYGQFVSRIVMDRKLIRVYYYNCPIQTQDGSNDTPHPQQAFFAALERLPYFTLRLGRLAKKNSRWVEKGVDVYVTVDMLKGAYKDNYDVAILVSGDADYAELVNEVKEQGKHVEVVLFRSMASTQLIKACDRRIEVTDELLQGCWLRS